MSWPNGISIVPETPESEDIGHSHSNKDVQGEEASELPVIFPVGKSSDECRPFSSHFSTVWFMVELFPQRTVLILIKINDASVFTDMQCLVVVSLVFKQENQRSHLADDTGSP